MEQNQNQQATILKIVFSRLGARKRTDWEQVEYVRKKVIPLLALAFPESFDKMHTKQCVELSQLTEWRQESEFIADIKCYYDMLKQRLTQAGLIDNVSIKKSMCIFEARQRFDLGKSMLSTDSGNICSECNQALEKHKIYLSLSSFFPSYSRCLSDELENLCSKIFALGYEKLLKGLVTFRESDQYQHLPNNLKRYICTDCRYVYENKVHPVFFDDLDSKWTCLKCNNSRDYFLTCSKNSELSKQVEIDTFTFSRNDHKLKKPENELDTSLITLQRSLYFLAIIKWSHTNTAHGIFKRRRLQYRNPQECMTEIQLSQAYNIKMRLNVMAGKKSWKKTNSDNRKVVGKISNMIINQPGMILDKKFLDSIEADDKNFLDEILNTIQTYISKKLATHDTPEVYPEALVLIFEDRKNPCQFDRLLLSVKWCNCQEILLLHSFTDTGGVTRDFIKKLIDNPGVFMSFEETSDRKPNIKKYLNKIGISGILYELLIENKTGNKVALKNPPTRLYRFLPPKLNKLKKILGSLDTERFHY